MLNLPNELTNYIYSYLGCSTSKIIRVFWETNAPMSINWDEYETCLNEYREYRDWCYYMSAVPKPLCDTRIRTVCKFKYIIRYV